MKTKWFVALRSWLQRKSFLAARFRNPQIEMAPANVWVRPDYRLLPRNKRLPCNRRVFSYSIGA